MITHGDSSLAEFVDYPHNPFHYENLWMQLAFVWDAYGLADETMNPTSNLNPHRERTGGIEHATTVPRTEMINQAMNSRLSDLVDVEDRWMLGIPRTLIPGKPSTDILTSSTGGAVMLMPMSAYGTLFRWNEFIAIESLRRHRKEQVNPRGVSAVGLGSYLVSGTHPDVERHPYNYIGLLMELDKWAYSRDGAAHRRGVWERTIFQQSMMILHEFGHIEITNQGFANSEVAQKTHSRRGSQFQQGWDRFENEMAADRRSLKWLSLLVESLMDSDADARAAIWNYFALLTLVTQNDSSVSPWALQMRYLFLLKDLDLFGCSPAAHEVFQDVCSVVGGYTREDFICRQYRWLTSPGRTREQIIENITIVSDLFTAIEASFGPV